MIAHDTTRHKTQDHSAIGGVTSTPCNFISLLPPNFIQLALYYHFPCIHQPSTLAEAAHRDPAGGAMRHLKHHEQKLLKKVDFLNVSQESGLPLAPGPSEAEPGSADGSD
jgi:hypothetical protein